MKPLKGLQSFKLGKPKGYHSQWNVYERGTFSVKTGILKMAMALEFWASLPIKLC